MFSIIDEHSDENAMENSRNNAAAISKNSKSVKRRVFADIPTNIEIPLQSSAAAPKFKIIDPEEHETTSIDESNNGRMDETFVKVWRTPVRKSQSLQLPTSTHKTSASSPASKQRKTDKSPAISSNYAKFMAANSEHYINNQLLPLPTAQYLNRSSSCSELAGSPASVVCETRQELNEALVRHDDDELVISDTFIIAPRELDTTRIITTNLDHQSCDGSEMKFQRVHAVVIVGQVVILSVLLLILFYFV